MANKKSTDISNSRYSQGGSTEVKGSMIGWWERKPLSKSPLDVTFTITKRYAGRPDLVAFDMYGKTTLMWVVLQYNTILDITEDFKEGAVITLPTRSRLFSELLSGKSSTVFVS